MHYLTKIEDATAFIRMPKGLFKQVDVYHRGETIYIPHGTSFVRVVAPFGDEYPTSNPNVTIVEWDGVSFEIIKGRVIYKGKD